MCAARFANTLFAGSKHLEKGGEVGVKSRLPFGCPNIRQRPGGANLQLAGGNNTATDFDPTTFDPSTVIPYLNNNPIPVVDPADIKALWQLQKNLKAKYVDNNPSDAVFKALATIPMNGIKPGSNLQGPPLDMQEFIKLILKESKA